MSPTKLQGSPTLVTPSCVGKCLRLTFSSDLEEATFETGKSLSAISKFDSVLEKNQPIYIVIFVFAGTIEGSAGVSTNLIH